MYHSTCPLVKTRFTFRLLGRYSCTIFRDSALLTESTISATIQKASLPPHSNELVLFFTNFSLFQQIFIQAYLGS